jgi:outer membrane lipoprotein LolB
MLISNCSIFSFGRLFAYPQAPRRAALGLAAAAVVALAGCASVKPREPSTSNATTSVTAQTTRAYHGRFAVQYVDQNGQQRNAYGNFDWQEAGDDVTIASVWPSGLRSCSVADNVSTLMQNSLGFALPVEGLRYWLQPSAAPTSRAKTEQDPQDPSHLKEIVQDGWTIDYIAYADAPATGLKRVNLSREQPPLDIKLVLDQ